MDVRFINAAELQLVEIIIKKSYKKLETHKLESHLYSMFDAKEFEDSRSIAEELFGCINDYMYSSEEPVMNVDFKIGMDELSFWSMRLVRKFVNKPDTKSKIAVELLMDLINDINLCESKMKDNLSRLGLVA